MADKTPDPSQPSKAQQKQLAAVAVCRDVAAGTALLREKAQTYLPRFPLESAAGYAVRVSQAVLFNGFARTVEGLAGMVMAQDPELGEDVPAEIRGNKDGSGGHWEDIDNAGTHGDVFVADRLDAALTDGHSLIFVDMPPKNPEVASLLDEQRLAIRPFWVPIDKANVLRWSTVRDGGRVRLASFAYRHEVVERDPKDEYSEVCYTQVREYWLSVDPDHGGKQQVAFRVWRRDGEGGQAKWSVTPAAYMSISEIPLAVIYGGKRTGFLESKPPLEDLAYENISHFQHLSDYRNALHVAGIPIPWANGLAEGEVIKAAPDEIITLPTGGTLNYLEPTGAALGHSRTEIQDSQMRMASLGIAMLQPETRAAETAEGKRIDKAAKDSALSRTARSLEDGIEQALRFHAMWLGKGTDAGGSITINRDFERLVLSPAEVTEMRTLVREGRWSVDLLWDRLEAGGWMPRGFDRELEKSRLEKTAAAAPSPFGSPGAKPTEPGRPPAPKPGDQAKPEPTTPGGVKP